LEHFRRLASFEGREDRASFWPYAALVFAIVTIAGSVMLISTMVRSLRAVQDFTVEPGEVNFASDLSGYSATVPPHSPAFMPSAGFLVAYLATTLGLAVLLYAAAVVRRLHDRGMSGAWGLMPLPFLAYTSAQLLRLFGSMDRDGQADMTLFFTIAVGVILYWASLLALVVLLAGASNPGRNRYDLGD
jgi:uncharacterized membrane protein YhaH (DUF805 family)